VKCVPSGRSLVLIMLKTRELSGAHGAGGSVFAENLSAVAEKRKSRRTNPYGAWTAASVNRNEGSVTDAQRKAQCLPARLCFSACSEQHST
jgi:hypothetical protein